MPSDIYESQIRSNGEAAENNYTAVLEQLKTDIANLKGIVSSTINDEVDRVIPKTEKDRIMNNYSNELVQKKVRGLKASEYFKITGTNVQDFPNSRDIALGEIKPGDLEMPASFNPTMPEKDRIDAWNRTPLDTRKGLYYDSLSLTEQEIYVFKGISEQDKINAIKSDSNIFFDALSEDDKLYLIAQYSSREDEEEGNRQKFNNKLQKSQARKDRLKASIKQAAEAVIKSMDATIEKNNELIRKLENQILQKKQELLELKQKPIDVSKYYQVKNQSLTPAEVETIERTARQEAITNLENSINELQQDLINAKDAQKQITESLKRNKKVLEKILSDKDIFVGSQSIKDDDTKSDSVLPDAASDKFGMVATGNTQLSQRKKAKNMLENMLEGSDSQDFRDMLNQYSYDDLVSMAHQLRGPFNKNKLNRFYDIALEDMETSDHGINTMLQTECGIQLTDLRNMTSLEPDRVKRIQDLLTDLNANYSTRSQEDKQRIDLLMDYIKVGMLRKETEHFRGLRSLFNRQTRQRLKMLTTQLTKHAKNVYDERNGILDRYNSFRKSIHVAEVDKSKIIRTPNTPNRNERDQHVL